MTKLKLNSAIYYIRLILF